MKEILTNIQDIPIKQQRLLFKKLDIIEQGKLNELEKCNYLILKYSIFGKDEFIQDPYTTMLLFELITKWIKNGIEIPVIFKHLLIYMLLDWLIDWDNSDQNRVIIKQDIYENLQTITNPFFEEIEQIIEGEYKSIERRNIQQNIVQIMEDLINFEVKEKLIYIYLSIFNIKYAVETAREYLCTDRLKEIILNNQAYYLDIQSLTHILLRHTQRYKTSGHSQNLSERFRSFIIVNLGEELDKIENILKDINKKEHLNTNEINLDDEIYKCVLKDERIVSLYPKKNR